MGETQTDDTTDETENSLVQTTPFERALDAKYGGTRTIRANGRSTRIVTLSRQTLELAALGQDDRVSLHAVDDATGVPIIRVDAWLSGHPELDESVDWRDAGVRKVRANGSSSVVTLTETALEHTATSDDAALYQYAQSGTLYLVPALQDRDAAPTSLGSYVDVAGDSA